MPVGEEREPEEPEVALAERRRAPTLRRKSPTRWRGSATHKSLKRGRCVRRRSLLVRTHGYAASRRLGADGSRPNSTSSRWMREPVDLEDAEAQTVARTSSPGSAARPSRPKTKPAIVW